MYCSPKIKMTHTLRIVWSAQQIKQNLFFKKITRWSFWISRQSCLSSCFLVGVLRAGNGSRGMGMNWIIFREIRTQNSPTSFIEIRRQICRPKKLEETAGNSKRALVLSAEIKNESADNISRRTKTQSAKIPANFLIRFPRNFFLY